MESWLRNQRGEWYVVVQTVIFAVILVGPWGDVLSVDVSEPVRAAAFVLGFVLGGAGFWLAVMGAFNLGANLSVLPHPKEGAQLVVRGAYRLVRHPIYSGLIIGAVGWALLNLSLMTLGYALVLFVFFDVKSRREERELVRKFPEYVVYRQAVRKLIPLVY